MLNDTKRIVTTQPGILNSLQFKLSYYNSNNTLLKEVTNINNTLLKEIKSNYINNTVLKG